METLNKKMVVGLSRRTDWEGKLWSVLDELVSTLGMKLDESESAQLAALPAAVANLIYAGVLESVVLDFAGAACEVWLVYYPEVDEEPDDLDLSVLNVADWVIEALEVRLRVDDVEHATALLGGTLEDLCSAHLTVQFEQTKREETKDDEGEAGERGDEEKPSPDNAREKEENHDGKEE
jgi:hypothetical protein